MDLTRRWPFPTDLVEHRLLEGRDGGGRRRGAEGGAEGWGGDDGAIRWGMALAFMAWSGPRCGAAAVADAPRLSATILFVPVDVH